MFTLIVNHVLGHLPEWIWPAAAGAGLALYFLFGIISHFPEMKIYGTIGRPVSFLIFVIGVFFYGGAGVIGKLLGLNLGSLTNARQKQFIEDNGLDSVTSKAHNQIKGEKGTDEYRNNPLYKEAMRHASSINSEVRDILHQHYENMPQDEVKNHLLSTFIKANEAHTLP